MADYRQIATQAAQTYGIPVDTFLSLLGAESSWNPSALSTKGAIGIGQLMPATAKELGVDPYDPEQNIYGSAKYLAQQFKRFGDPTLAVAAYNAGPAAVAKYGGVPPYEETQNYVARVLGTQMADQVTPPQMAPQQAAGYQPFSPDNLSRSQRTMLGFAALRDAAAALRGNQTGYFGEALGGLQQEHKYGQELAFRQGQEQRILGQERQTRELTLLQQRRLIQTERDKAYNLGMPTTGYDAQLAAVDGALSQMGSAFAPSVAPATPAMQPATVAPAETGTEQPAPPRMTLDDANKLLTGGAATPQQLRDAADFFLRNDMTDRANMALAAAQQLEAQTQAAEEEASAEAGKELMLTPRVGSAIDFLSSESAAQRIRDNIYKERVGLIPDNDYIQYRNTLLTIKALQGMKSIAEARATGWTGAMTDTDIKIIMSTVGTLDESDPQGTLRTLNEMRMKLEEAGAEFGQPTADDLVNLYTGGES